METARSNQETLLGATQQAEPDQQKFDCEVGGRPNTLLIRPDGTCTLAQVGKHRWQPSTVVWQHWEGCNLVNAGKISRLQGPAAKVYHPVFALACAVLLVGQRP